MQAKSALLILLAVRTTHSQQDSLPPLILPEPPKAPATPDPRDAFIQAINNNVIAPQQQPPAADPAPGQGFGNFDREPQFSPPTEAPFTTPSNRFPVQDNRAVFEPPRQDRRPQRPLVDEFGNPLGDVHSGDFEFQQLVWIQKDLFRIRTKLLPKLQTFYVKMVESGSRQYLGSD
jgi:hypothetical protein